MVYKSNESQEDLVEHCVGFEVDAERTYNIVTKEEGLYIADRGQNEDGAEAWIDYFDLLENDEWCIDDL